MTFDQWRASAVGRGMNPDGVYGYQCVDVPKDYAQAIFPGVSWVDSIGYGNAKDLFSGPNPKYFDKIPNNPNDPNQVPQPGDIIVYNGWAANPYGHIAVVIAADQSTVTVIEQDGFTPTRPAYQVTRGYGAFPLIGWLRPKLSVNVAPDQRVVGPNGVNYRRTASTSGEVLNTFDPGAIIDLKGFVHGEAVDGNDTWFVGRYTGGYLWSGAFEDKGVAGLADITPVPPSEEPNQRTVGDAGVNYRKYPFTAGDILKSFSTGDVLDFDAFARAEMVSGNNVWFRGKYTGGWAWSGAFTNAGTAGLPEVAAPSIPDRPEQPPVNPVYSTRPDVVNTLWGIDISSFQGAVDVSKVKGVVDYAIIRAGHVGPSFGGGEFKTDTKFKENQALMRDNDVPLGYYWYGYPVYDPVVEAQYFVNSVGEIRLGESLWLDLEETDPADVNKKEWASKFINEVERLTGQVCHIYTYWNYAKTNSELAQLVTGNRKLWLAHYDMAAGSDLSGQPLGAPVMHQYTSKGLLEGITGSVDLNVFYGTVVDFEALGKKTIPTDPDPNPDPEPNDPTPEPEPKPEDPKPDTKLRDQIVAFINAFIEALRKIFTKGK